MPSTNSGDWRDRHAIGQEPHGFVQLLVTFCHEKASPYRVKRVRTRCTVLLRLKCTQNCACQHNRRTRRNFRYGFARHSTTKNGILACGRQRMGCAMGVMGLLEPYARARRRACCRLCECAYIALRTYPLPCAMFSVAPASRLAEHRAQAPRAVKPIGRKRCGPQGEFAVGPRSVRSMMWLAVLAAGLLALAACSPGPSPAEAPMATEAALRNRQPPRCPRRSRQPRKCLPKNRQPQRCPPKSRKPRKCPPRSRQRRKCL